MYSSYGFVKGARASLRKKGSKGQLSSRGGSQPELNLPASSKTDADWEFPRDDLEDLKQIGHGQFGVVYIGTANNIVSGEAQTQVAIKTLADTSAAAKAEFNAEAKIMKAIDNNNIIRLLGVCTEKEPMYMIMEYMGKGDLKGFLRNNRPLRGHESSISQRKLCEMGAGIAHGMGYLAKMHIVHRDLAARNCLVSDTLEVKVGDFGLTRKTYSREYYRMTGSAPLPIRWMPPESFQDGVFSTASDIWAFGIVLWEIQTFGKLPYAAYDNAQVAEEVAEDDYRLSSPGGCPPEIYKVMSECWEEDREDRGTFDKHQTTLSSLAPTLSTENFKYETLQGHGESDANPNAHEYEDPEEYAELNDDPAAGYDQNDMMANLYYDDSSAAPDPSLTYSQPQDFSSEAVQLQKTVAQWITRVTGKIVHDDDLQQSLKSGETLCILINKLKSGSVRKIHSAKHALKQRENISHFLKSAKNYGLKLQHCFLVDDLYDDEDMARVIVGLHELKKISENN